MRTPWPLVLLLVLAGCGGNEAAVDLGGGDLSVAVDVAMPPDLIGAPPQLGAIVDRIGRPGTAWLMVDPFDWDGQRAATLDAYNHSDNSDGPSRFAASMADHLAVWDILDGKCGNAQPKKPAPVNGAYPSASYLPMANVYSDDQLYLDPRLPVCGDYLLIEQVALVGGPNDTYSTCGGRMPNYYTMDGVYIFLSGSLSTQGGAGAKNLHPPSYTDFPFLATPVM